MYKQFPERNENKTGARDQTNKGIRRGHKCQTSTRVQGAEIGRQRVKIVYQKHRHIPQ